MTFLSSTYQQEFYTIVNDIQNEAEDDSKLITTVVGPPRIPQLALALQFLIFKEQRFSLKRIRDYCTSTILVQMGLNIHNEVSPNNDIASDPVQNKHRQLQVLAGDLYSGKFYRRLAYSGDIRVIHLLADAICMINRARTNLYDLLIRNKLSVKQYIQEVESICPALLKCWLKHMPASSGKWDPLVSNLLTAEKLMVDLNGSLPVHWHTSVRRKVQQLIEHSQRFVQEWGEPETGRELENLINIHFPEMTEVGKAAEEC